MPKIIYTIQEVIFVHEYVLICPTKEGAEMLEKVPMMLEYLLKDDFEGTYMELLYECWAHPLDQYDQIFANLFSHRYDYRYEDHLHTLYNELTKEMTIIHVKRCQIILKCDKIPRVVIETIQQDYPTLRVFCRDRDFEEVKQ